MRKKWAERKDEQDTLHGKGPQAIDSLQVVATTIIDKASKTYDVDNNHAKDAKSRACEVDQEKGLTRKRLRDELQEQAKASRQKQIDADCTPVQPKQKPKQVIKGNDAIARLLNIGRLPQGGLQVETKGNVGVQQRELNAGTCSSRATVGVVASSSIVVPGVL